MPTTKDHSVDDITVDDITIEELTIDDLTITSDDDVEFAIGAARYLRQSGLHDEAIAASLVDQLGIDLSDARSITLTI